MKKNAMYKISEIHSAEERARKRAEREEQSKYNFVIGTMIVWVFAMIYLFQKFN
jgi:hypothetical protein